MVVEVERREVVGVVMRTSGLKNAKLIVTKFKHEVSWRMFSGSTYLTVAVTLQNLQSERLQMAERGEPNQYPSQRGAVRGERGIEGQLRMAIGHCKLTKRSVTKGSRRL